MDTSPSHPESDPIGDYFGMVWPASSRPDLTLTVPFTTLFLRSEGIVSDFRTGRLQVSAQGIRIEGRAVMPYVNRERLLVIGSFFGVFVPLYMAVEWGMRHEQTLTLSWQQIRYIVMVPEKRRLCLVYDLANDRGVIKTYSLAFRLDQARYDQFQNLLLRFAKNQTRLGTLQIWMSPSTWAFLISTVILCILMTVFAVVLTHFIQDMMKNLPF